MCMTKNLSISFLLFLLFAVIHEVPLSEVSQILFFPLDCNAALPPK